MVRMDKGCVFCDRAQFEERLIFENRDWYVIATLGQITDGGYVLLVSRRHAPCVGSVTEPEIAELCSVLEIARQAVEKEYDFQPIIFEHGIVGQTIQHAHLHLLPVEINLNRKVLDDFPNEDTDLVISPEAFETFRRVYASCGGKYLLCGNFLRSLRGYSLMLQVVWDPPAPAQYLRKVAAELLGRPERANWRNMDPELDKRLWKETVERLRPYFRHRS